MTHPKHPRRLAEWFGFPIEVRSPEAKHCRQAYCCPFVSGNPRCIKRTRLLPHPFGVCSVEFSPHGILALCPHRFLEGHRVFRDIAQHSFGTLDNLLLFTEVRAPGRSVLGRFDYILAQHAPLSNEILDFVLIEFQAAQTTSTGALVHAVRDYLEGNFNDASRGHYNFGINWADIWKRSLIQALLKGMAAKAWHSALYWVVQTPVYDNLAHRYGLPTAKQGTSLATMHKTIRFALYDLQREGEAIHLVGPRWLAFSVDDLFDALRYQIHLPAREDMLSHLQSLLRNPTLSLKW